MALPDSVLIVDDELHIRLMLKKLFNLLNITDVREARNGKEAIEAYCDTPTDVVLMDINMPVMDGLTALGKILETDPEAVVIMLTSVDITQVVESSARMGATYYFRKDMPLVQIKEKLLLLFDEIFEA